MLYMIVLPVKGTQVQTWEFLVVAESHLKLLDEGANFANCQDMPVFLWKTSWFSNQEMDFCIGGGFTVLQDILVQHC